MRTSETMTKIAPALTKALAEMKNPPKTHKANVGKFSYTYAGLPEIIDASRPILAKHKLTVLQSAEATDGHIAIVTTILHESGEWVSSAPLSIAPLQTDPQKAGIAITYGRRYSLTAMLGLAPDDDTDGQGFGSQKPPAARQAPPADTGLPPRDGPAGGSPRNVGISEKQVKMIYGKGGELYGKDAGMNDYKQFLLSKYNVAHLEELTKAQGKEVIDELLADEAERKAKQS